MEMLNIYKQYIIFKRCLAWNIYTISDITIVLYRYYLLLPFRLVFIIIITSQAYTDKNRRKFTTILYLLTNSLTKLGVLARNVSCCKLEIGFLHSSNIPEIFRNFIPNNFQHYVNFNR